MFYCLILQYKLKENELYQEDNGGDVMVRKLSTNISVRNDKCCLNGINNPSQWTVDIYEKENNLLSFKAEQPH